MLSWSQFWRMVISGSWIVISDMVLMIEKGLSLIEGDVWRRRIISRNVFIFEKVKFHLSWLFLLWFWSLMDNDYFIYGLDYWSLCHVRMGCKHGLNCEGKLFLVLLIEGGWLQSWSLKPWLITSGIVWWLKKELDIE